jgi:aldehyde:ferredoxin oxidoreductase
MYGYLGKLLFVDLTTGRMRDEPLNIDYARHFIGNSGLAARYLYDMVESDTDPLGPDNPLIMMTGLLTGTRTPSASRHAFVARSRARPTWAASPATSCAAPATTASSSPDRPRRPSTCGSKKGRRPNCATRATCGVWILMLPRHASRKSWTSAARGWPASAPLAKTWSVTRAILNADARAAGRTGMGAVMGSKRLKAIALRGKRPIPIAEKERFKQAARRSLIRIQGDFSVQVIKATGTSGGMDYFDMIGSVPARYWTQGVFDGVDNLNGGLIAETIATGRTGCWGCAVQCGFEVEVPDSAYPVPKTDGPEYETLCALGSQLLIGDLGAVCHFDLLCDSLGLDTISTGGCIGFAFWLFNNGHITSDQTDGLTLTWGDPAPVVELIHKITARDGFGAVLADGVLAMEKSFNVPGMAVQVNGLDPGLHDPRAMSGMALVYLTSPRGACHNKGDFYFIEAGHSFSGFDITSDGHHHEAGKAPVVARHQDYRGLINASGCCQFVNVPFRELPELFSAAWGEAVSLEELYAAGERIFNLKRALNLKLGLDPRRSEVLPKLWTRPLDEGGTRGYVPDWETMLREYYDYRAWDWETGRPYPEKLAALGLEDIARDLWGAT